MKKFLVFTNGNNYVEKVGYDLFQLLGIVHYDGIAPVYFDNLGMQTMDIEKAVFIILPDADIISDSNQYNLAYAALNFLRENACPLYIIWHLNGWNYFETDYTEVADKKMQEYLQKQQRIGASHVESHFYGKELRTIANAINRIDSEGYQKALEETKKIFPDPLQEASIHLWKALTLLGVKLKRGQINAKEFAMEIETIKRNEKIKDQQEIVDLIPNFKTVEDFHEMIQDPTFQKSLFPEPTR